MQAFLHDNEASLKADIFSQNDPTTGAGAVRKTLNIIGLVRKLPELATLHRGTFLFAEMLAERESIVKPHRNRVLAETVTVEVFTQSSGKPCGHMRVIQLEQ